MDSVHVVFAVWLKRSSPAKNNNMQVLLKPSKIKWGDLVAGAWEWQMCSPLETTGTLQVWWQLQQDLSCTVTGLCVPPLALFSTDSGDDTTFVDELWCLEFLSYMWRLLQSREARSSAGLRNVGTSWIWQSRIIQRTRAYNFLEFMS